MYPADRKATSGKLRLLYEVCVLCSFPPAVTAHPVMAKPGSVLMCVIGCSFANDRVTCKASAGSP